MSSIFQFVQYGPPRGQQPESAARSTGSLPLDMEQSLASYDFCDLILKQTRPTKGTLFYALIFLIISNKIVEAVEFNCIQAISCTFFILGKNYIG